MELLAVLLAGAALWVASGARARAAQLERALAALREEIAQTRPAPAHPPGTETGQVPDPAVLPRAARAATEPEAREQDNFAPREAPATGWPRAGQSPGALARLGPWLRDHWIYPTAGVALVLSGVFLVQYAVEAGLLTPRARVVFAILMGAALMAGGEWLRRKPLAGVALPATLTGAGIVIVMAAVLAALHLYAMISPAMALITLALLSFGAIALGWLHGPMLPALGLIAGPAMPFVLGGGGPPPAALFGYFALLAFAGLAIDAQRRWGWVTWLALAGPLAAMVLWRLGGGDAMAFAMALLAVAGATMTLPFGYIAPLVDGPPALGRARPVAGVRASFVASAVAAVGIALLVPGMAGPVALAALAALIALWCLRAPALADQMLLPVLAMPLWIVWQGWTQGPVVRAIMAIRAPESAMPLQASFVLGLAALAGLAMLWRGEKEEPGRHAPWTLAGLLLPGAAMVALETIWQPALVLGNYPWALHAMALAALATMLALRYGARDAGQGPRLGAAAAAAFALLALGMMLILGQAALTMALAVLMVAAAAMDRRFDIPALGVFQVLAMLALTWRLVLDPGLDWHLQEASLPEVLASVSATLAGPLLALWLSRSLSDAPARRYTRLVVETGVMGAAAIAAGVLIVRILPDEIGVHAGLGLQASVLIALAWVQVRRAALPVLPRLRRGLAWLLGAAAALALAAAVLPPFSPVFGGWFLASRVAGWPVLNDLLLAYLLPAVLLVMLAGWRWLRLAGWALGAVWAASAIRHLWQGADLRIERGFEQGELYAYTFALLVVGAVLLARALQSARPDLRKIGLTFIALAAAKAFLVDAAELDGLMRVGAFLGLGLSLAGLAWLNGWAVARETSNRPAAEGS